MACHTHKSEFHFTFDLMAYWGIDLGTTYSSIAICKNKGTIEVIPDPSGKYSISSTVIYKDGEVIVGTQAEQQKQMYTDRVVFDSKRIIGRHMGDGEDRRAIYEMKDVWPFEIEENPNGCARIVLRTGRRLEAYEVSGEILKYLYNMARQRERNPTNKAVITVPASFTDQQKADTKRAAEYAGFGEVELISEPTAAAIAFGVAEKGYDRKQTVLVFDFGGGTLDVSILEFQNNKFTVKGAPAGITRLGGRDIDEALLNFVLETTNHTDILEKAGHRSNKVRAKRLARVREAVIDAKKQLSENTEAEIVVDLGDDELEFILTRADFERVCGPIFSKVLDPVKEAMANASISKKDIDVLLCVGGSSKIPYVQRIVSDFIGKRAIVGVDPEQAVVKGAAIVAASKWSDSGPSITYTDVCPFDIGVSILGGVMSPVLNKGTAYGSAGSSTYWTVFNYQTSVSFDVYEGLRKVAKANKLLGSFKVSGLPSKLAEEVAVNVTFTLGKSDGTVNIKAECPGVETKCLTVTRDSTKYSSAEIFAMQASAESQSVDDEKEAAKLREHGNLDALYGNVVSLLTQESRMEKILGPQECERIKKDAREKREKLRLDDVRIGDLAKAKEEYRRALEKCFDGQIPKFLK